MADNQEQLVRIMNGLKCSKEEALEVMAYDKAVDRNEKTSHDLSREKTAIARMYTHTGTRKTTAYSFKKPITRKANPTKRDIIQALQETLSQFSSDVTVTNPERQLDFVVENTKYRIVLSAPRK